MSLCLIRLPYSSSVYTVYKTKAKRNELRPPYGLECIAGATRSVGITTNILDAEALRFTTEDIIAHALEYEIVGIGVTTPEYAMALEIFARIKQEKPKCITVLGGPHIRIRLMKEPIPNVDYCIEGDGEEEMIKIALKKERPLSTIFRIGTCSLDAYHVFKSHLHATGIYAYPIQGRFYRTDTIVTSRGCPNKCIFCVSNGSLYCTRGLSTVIAEMESSVVDFGTELYMFLDDTLTANVPRLFDLCVRLRKSVILQGVKYWGSLRANTVTEEVIYEMKKTGFVELTIGVESLSPAMLKNMRKNHTVEQVANAMRIIKKHGIVTRASFIVGAPFESKETIDESIRACLDMDIDRISVNTMTPYPGTELWELAHIPNSGIQLESEDMRDYRRWGHAVVSTPYLSSKELQYHQKRFLMEFYSSKKTLANYARFFLQGNRDKYFYRPVLDAIRMRIRGIK